jgi:hypothetical protein
MSLNLGNNPITRALWKIVIRIKQANCLQRFNKPEISLAKQVRRKTSLNLRNHPITRALWQIVIRYTGKSPSMVQ